MNSVKFDDKDVYPSKIVCIGRNYVEHIKELNNEIPCEPVFFLKPNSAVCGEIYTDSKDPVHYEGEISFLIFEGAISAVGFGLDLTKREIQSRLKSKGLPWERAKAFDRSAVFSSFVPFEGDPESLRLELYINDLMVQSGGCRLMIYKPSNILKSASEFLTFEDGDVLMTGTPKGVGTIAPEDRFTGRIYMEENLLIEKSWNVKTNKI